MAQCPGKAMRRRPSFEGTESIGAHDEYVRQTHTHTHIHTHSLSFTHSYTPSPLSQGHSYIRTRSQTAIT